MKKTVLKLIGTLFLITALVLTQIPPSASNAESVTVNHGFLMDGSKLVKYTGTETSVSVPAGVEVIGAEAFTDCVNLKSIQFPTTLIGIESGAFSGCHYLEKAIIPTGCQYIDKGAFAECDGLKYVELPYTLNDLGTSVFAGCDSLKSVNIHKMNPNYVCIDGVIYDDECNTIYQVLAGREAATYRMPQSVTEIKKYAFWGCKNLEEINMSSYLEQIDDYAFSNASGLEAMVLPYSVRSIGIKSFEDCRNLEDVFIPISVTKIDSTAFDGCYRLHIVADPGTIAAEFYDEFENNPASRVEYEDHSVSANSNPHWLPDVEEHDETIRESKSNVSDVDNYIEWDVDSTGVLGRTKVVSRQAVVLVDTNDITVYEGTNAIASGNDKEEAAVDMSSAIIDEAIVNKAFYQDESLISVTIPQYINTIGDFAFARSGLTSVQIPKGVTKIGTGAFYHCDKLASVSIPVTVREIEADAFTNSKWLNNWYSGGDVNEFLVVGDGVLLAYKGSRAMVTIPSNVKTIAPGVFKDHDEITQVTIPNGVEVIGEEAFADCNALTNISGGKNIKEIRDRAFYGCPIMTVRIPETVETIGIMAFGGTGSTDSVVFLGDKLPKVTYEDSATRLSNERGYCFTDISTAIVNPSVSEKDMTGTVLDKEILGFEGYVYNLTEISNGGEARPVFSTQTKEETLLPDNIYVYNKRYQVIDKDKVACAEQMASVSDNSLEAMMVVDHSELKKEQISVTTNGSVDNLDGYHFYISNPGQGTNALKEQIQKHFGEINDENSFFMSLSLYDATDTIPIHQLGRNPITIMMPVPPKLLDDELCVVTLDDNNNPEVTFVNWLEKDGQTYISFDLKHCSPYALYGAEGELKDKITEKRSRASRMMGLDDTPDTGDNLNINLILTIGLGSLGVFLLLLGFMGKGNRKQTKA